jgi:hypothetical protein
MSRVLARLVLAGVLSVAAFGGSVAAPSSADAASCVRISGGRFDAPGNDNYAAYLNGEYVRIKNYCSTAKYLTGYRIHDYGRKHTYYFRSGTRIAAYATITLYSGRGTNTSTRVYWGRTYGAVWNNTPPERAYLRNSAGTLLSSWSLY